MKVFSRQPQSLVLVAAIATASNVAMAQTNDINNLEAIGANATQASVGRFINDWLGTNASFENGTAEQQELYAICDEYATAAIDAGDAAAVSSALELLDFVANEEVAVAGSGLTDTGHDVVSSVLGRMQNLRSTTPAVASVNGVTYQGGAAGDVFSRLSYYVNVSYGDGDKDRTTNEQGFDFDSKALTLGADYRYDDNIVAGVALGFGQADADIDNNLGSTESDTLSLTFYGTYYVDDWYVDASIGFSQYDYDNVRNLPLASQMLMSMAADQTLKSSTDGDSFNLSIGGGLTQQYDGWNVDYSARLNRIDASVDGYTESGGSLRLEVGDQDIESLQAVIGAQASKAFSTERGVFVPYVGVEMRQEFDDDTRVVTARYVLDQANNQFSFTSDDADSNYFLLSLGSSFVLAQGKQLFVNYDRIVGLSDVTSNTLTGGIRFEL